MIKIEPDFDPRSPNRGGIYHGWPIAVVSFLAIAGAIGFGQYAFGLFIVPLEQDFGWSRTQITGAIILGVVLHLFSPLI